jgi:hypothetical protein
MVVGRVTVLFLQQLARSSTDRAVLAHDIVPVAKARIIINLFEMGVLLICLSLAIKRKCTSLNFSTAAPSAHVLAASAGFTSASARTGPPCQYQ